MKKIITAILVIMSLGTVANASEVYFGALLDSSYRSSPSQYNNKPAKYVAGVELENKFFELVTPHIMIETLMDQSNGNGSFHPASVKYDIGLKVDIYKGFKIDVSRMCWHPVDSSGHVEEYWSIKGKYEF